MSSSKLERVLLHETELIDEHRVAATRDHARLGAWDVALEDVHAN